MLCSHCCGHQTHSHFQCDYRPESVRNFESFIVSCEQLNRLHFVRAHLIVIHKRNASDGTAVDIFECFDRMTVAGQDFDGAIFANCGYVEIVHGQPRAHRRHTVLEFVQVADLFLHRQTVLARLIVEIDEQHLL